MIGEFSSKHLPNLDFPRNICQTYTYKQVDASASYSVSSNHSSVNDFIDMYNNNPQVIFCKDAAALNLYK